MNAVTIFTKDGSKATSYWESCEFFNFDRLFSNLDKFRPDIKQTDKIKQDIIDTINMDVEEPRVFRYRNKDVVIVVKTMF